MYNKLPMMKKILRFKNVYIIIYIKLCQKNIRYLNAFLLYFLITLLKIFPNMTIPCGIESTHAPQKQKIYYKSSFDLRSRFLQCNK